MRELAALSLIPLLPLVAGTTSRPGGGIWLARSDVLDKGGRVTTGFGEWSTSHPMAIQSDGSESLRECVAQGAARPTEDRCLVLVDEIEGER